MKRSENLEISKVFIDDAVKLISGNKKLLENIIVVSIDVYTHGKNSMYYRHTLTGNLK